VNDLAPTVTPQPLDVVEQKVKALSRPHKNLLTLYIIRLLIAFPAAPLLFLPMYFRYQTLRYRFDEDGVHASHGILLRREVSLTYARIQDIHVSRGPIERWLGLGSVQIQTASGAGAADLVIEGIAEFNEVRDFLYAKMRGATTMKKAPSSSSSSSGAGVVDAEAVQLLREITGDLKAVREALEAKRA
jgi:membrane protein YdbS with pleckstrin-like domain